MSPISNVANSTSGASAIERIPVQTLGQEDFLKLLVAQMSNQDPMNPKQDNEFIAQMAQFSSLEQSKSMQADIALMRSQQELQQANALLGRDVTVALADNTTVSGTVNGIVFEAGTPKIVINGKPYGLSQVQTIASSTGTAPKTTERVLL